MSIYSELGHQRLEEILTLFYDRLFADPFVGFLFEKFDKSELLGKQIQFTGKLLGSTDLKYTGKGLREAHFPHPIRSAHFGRRQVILRGVLEESKVPENLIEEWLSLENSLKGLIVKGRGDCET